jgi:hypothetical protein
LEVFPGKEPRDEREVVRTMFYVLLWEAEEGLVAKKTLEEKTERGTEATNESMHNNIMITASSLYF